MASAEHVVGVDFGTESCRVGIFTADGEALGFASRGYELTHPKPGWAEQDPGEWWSAFGAACSEVVGETGVDVDSIAGMSVDATSATVVASDEDGGHLRPAIMWMDVRASDEADRVADSGHEALKYNGHGPVSAEWGLPKMMWLAEHEPETYEQAARLVDCGDWLVKRLTGEWAGSVNYAASKYYHDRDTGGFPDDLYRAMGVSEALERYPDVVDTTHVTGELTAEAAEHLGLRAGIPVAQGAIDAYAGALGLGVVEPGSMALITGSSHVMIGQAGEPVHGQGFWGAYTDALVPGAYTVEAGQVSTGSVVAWFKNRLAGDIRQQAEERGVDPYVILNELAEDVPIGSDGLIVLDHFQGNRSPYTDPLSRGMLWGLTLSHTPGHIFRAIIEGICYGTETIFREMRAGGLEPTEFFVAGGPTNSPLWMQMHADVSNVPLSITRNGGDAPVLGSAMLAAVGAGLHDGIAGASQAMVTVERQVEPDEEAHERYAFYLDRYVRSYEQMQDLMHETARHVASGS